MFVTTFHNKHKNMEKILRKHRGILQQEPHLKPKLPAHPKVTYCRAPNLKDKIAPSKFKPILVPPSVPILIPLVGMYQCRKALCKTCKFVQHGQKSFTTKGKTYMLKEFFNCLYISLIYILYTYVHNMLLLVFHIS